MTLARPGTACAQACPYAPMSREYWTRTGKTWKPGEYGSPWTCTLDNQVDVSLSVYALPSGQGLRAAARELRAASRRLDWAGRLRVWQGPGKG